MIERVDRLEALGDRLGVQRFDVVASAVVGALVGLSVLLLLDPVLNRAIVDRTLDVALSSLSTLAAAGLGALAMLRYRESGRFSALLQASAFFTLASLSGITVLLVLLKLDGRVEIGLTLGLPQQLPLYVSALTWLTTAGIFAASGFSALRGAHGRTAHARWLVGLPILVIAALTLVLYPVRDSLPPLIDDEGLKLLIGEPNRPLPLPGITPLAYILVAVTTLLFFAGALIYRRAYLRQGRVADGVLAIALVIAGFAELQQGFYPGVYTGLVTTGYFLRLVAYAVLLIGIYGEQRADLRALRTANASLDRMRITETERAALEERTRLAREIHDGLAQQLWFAKLKFDRLASQLPDEVAPLSGEVSQALDSAIAEARQATVTMRTSIDQELPLSDMIKRAVEDFAQRSGLRGEVQSAPEVPGAVPPRHQVELLRILQESLTNVRRHADATVVRVGVEVVDGALLMSISDNGRGFELESARGDGLGLLGMEERARLIGGQLRVTSAPSEGTLVELRLPLMVPAGIPGIPEEAVDGGAALAAEAAAGRS
jgi:signal transduction histidine kinase